MCPIGADPYRTLTTAQAKPGRRARLADADVLIAFVVLAPAFLAVVVRTFVRGEPFGAGPTVCGLIVALTVGMLVSAWRRCSEDRRRCRPKEG
jgi:hypothetical protein